MDWICRSDQLAGESYRRAQAPTPCKLGPLLAIGAFSEILLGFFDRERKAYDEIPIREQVEVLALTGNFTEQDTSPRLHAHAVVGKRDGSAYGGHLLRATVFPTLEVVATEVAAELRRAVDPETGVALIRQIVRT